MARNKSAALSDDDLKNASGGTSYLVHFENEGWCAYDSAGENLGFSEKKQEAYDIAKTGSTDGKVNEITYDELKSNLWGNS